jgi:hypothetical protein
VLKLKGFTQLTKGTINTVESWEENAYGGTTVIHCQSSNKEKENMKSVHGTSLLFYIAPDREYIHGIRLTENIRKNIYLPLCIENHRCVLPPSIAHRAEPYQNHRSYTMQRPLLTRVEPYQIIGHVQCRGHRSPELSLTKSLVIYSAEAIAHQSRAL